MNKMNFEYETGCLSTEKVKENASKRL